MNSTIKEKVSRFKGDKVILILLLLLSLISILLVYSTEGKRVLSHLVHLISCYVGLGLCYFFNYQKIISKVAPLGLALAIALLLWTLGSSAVRGVTVLGFDLQTFYLIGFLIIIFLSNYLGRRLDNGIVEYEKAEVRYCSLVLIGFCGGIALLNMSTAIILFMTGMVMFFVARFKWKHMFVLAGFVASVVLVLVLFVSSGKLANVGRINTFVNRWEYYFTKDNTDGYGDQMILSRAAIARSGLKPAGPGKGVIKYRLPENSTDYAYASLFEETGIVVGVLIIFIYIAIFYRSWQISRNSKSATGALLAFGIGFFQRFHVEFLCFTVTCAGCVHPLFDASFGDE